MNIKKLNLENLKQENPAEKILPVTPKNFSFFAKKDNTEEPEFTKSDLKNKTEEASKSSFEEGYGKGKEEVVQTALALEQNTLAVAKEIVNKLDNFIKQYDIEKKNYIREMTKVTMIAISKIAKKTIKENSEEVIMQALEQASNIFSKQTEIIFKCKKNTLEKIQGKLEILIKEIDFKGKINYVADDNLADGSCLLEWGESGASINSSETLKQIEESLSEYLKSI